MISEKQMEDSISQNPEKYLKEPGLSLIGRQIRIGNYIFDLMFEDRHGGKLIVEIQKGTLDRNHTYKILDYYDAYREKNPVEFIDVLIVANRITAERKKRLEALGIGYIELPESLFIQTAFNRLHLENEDSPPLKKKSLQSVKPKEDYHFRSKAPSSFVSEVRNKLEVSIDKNVWKIGGKDSLTVIFIPTTNAIKNRIGAGLKTQIWLERPYQGKARCKFEVADKITSLDTMKSEVIRERIASSIRRYLIQEGLDNNIETTNRSTVVAVRCDLPRIKAPNDDTIENVKIYPDEIKKILAFLAFLEIKLLGWKDSRMFGEATTISEI